MDALLRKVGSETMTKETVTCPYDMDHHACIYADRINAPCEECDYYIAWYEKNADWADEI